MEARGKRRGDGGTGSQKVSLKKKKNGYILR